MFIVVDNIQTYENRLYWKACFDPKLSIEMWWILQEARILATLEYILYIKYNGTVWMSYLEAIGR